MAYIAVIHKDEDSVYGAHFPDFPGVMTAAKDEDELVHNMREALAIAVAEWAVDGLEQPRPTPLEEISRENQDAQFFLLVEAPPVPKSKRVNVTLNEDLLRRIDYAAQKRGMSRSAFLARGASVLLERQD